MKPLHRLLLRNCSILCAACISAGSISAAEPKPAPQEPPLVNPGPVGGPPSDAIVLFDGKDLSKWKSDRGGDAQWKVEDGTAIVNRTGSILTREAYGDCQLHVEWSAPTEVKGSGQDRGNSGVYLQGRYEIQVLDSHNNKTYFDGQAGAFYGNFPPLANPVRKPGDWNTYDIIFHAPRPGADGKEIVPGSFTVIFNGVLVQDHVPIKGSTTAAAFTGAVPKGPLVLQDHGSPVRYRNIWIRPLSP